MECLTERNWEQREATKLELRIEKNEEIKINKIWSTIWSQQISPNAATEITRLHEQTRFSDKFYKPVK